MPESTLSLKLSDLEGEVGYVMGWGRGKENGEEAWTTQKVNDVKRATESALRMFYFQAHSGDEQYHNWSFLKPVTEVTLEDGERTVELPDDFGAFEGPITISTDDESSYMPITLTQDALIDQWYASSPATTGWPRYAAERAIKGTKLRESSRVELYVFPEADADYTLKIRYSILPNYLTTANPYPYGGAAHAETLKSAARAAAEVTLKGMPLGAGPEWQVWQMNVAASVRYDRKMHTPRSLGLNLDYSSASRHMGFPHWYPQSILGYLPAVTWDGQVPG